VANVKTCAKQGIDIPGNFFHLEEVYEFNGVKCTARDMGAVVHFRNIWAQFLLNFPAQTSDMKGMALLELTLDMRLRYPALNQGRKAVEPDDRSKSMQTVVRYGEQRRRSMKWEIFGWNSSCATSFYYLLSY